MTKRTTLALSSLLVLAVACSKDKKEDTTPTVADNSGDAPAAAVEPTPPVDETSDPSAMLNETILFEFDSSDLDPVARAALEENAKWLEEDPSRELTIEGHTDASGTTEYNVALGDRRARTAKEYLVRLGIDSSRIRIISYGEERPASRDESKNRRGVFIATRK